MPEPRRVVPETGNRPGVNRTGSTIGNNLIVRVESSEDDSVQPVTAVTQIPYGVAAQDILDDQVGDIQIMGKATVLAGASVTRGALLTGDATSRAITASAGNQVLGTAVTSAGSAGDVIEVELQPQPSVAP